MSLVLLKPTTLVSIVAFLILNGFPAFAGCLAGWGASPGRDVPQELEGGVAISAARDHGLVLLSTGNLERWGANVYGLAIPESATNVTCFAAGYRHSAAVRADGTLLCWGQSQYGRLNVPSTATNVIALSAGEMFTAALRSDGTVVVWGTWFVDEYLTVSLPPDLTNVVAVSAGDNHLMCLFADGTVQVFGSYNFGQRDVPEGLNGVAQISAKGSHCLALRTNGVVIGWGQGCGSGQNVWTGIRSIAAGDMHDVAIRQNGTVVATGSNSDGQTSVPGGLVDVIAVGAGGNYSVALMNSCSATSPGTPVATPGTYVCNGTAVMLTIAPTGGQAPLLYQWLRNGAPVPDATSSALTVAAPAEGDQYACGVSSACGSSNISEVATLHLTPPAEARDLSVCVSAGATAQITVVDSAAAAAGIAVTAVSGGEPSSTVSFDGRYIYFTSLRTNQMENLTYTLGSGLCADTGTVQFFSVSPGGYVRNLRRTAQGISIQVAAVPGVPYSLERSATVDFTNPQVVWSGNGPAEGFIEVSDNAATDSTGFYRLVKLTP